jgi:hypothetical protein
MSRNGPVSPAINIALDLRLDDMPPDDVIAKIRPGSILLYSSPSIVDWLIERTGPCAHVELFLGNGRSFASRNGLGVNYYDLRKDGLIAIRSHIGVNVDTWVKWADTVVGDGYDWRGLEGFLIDRPTNEPHHEFCSAVIELGFRKSQYIELHNKLWPWSLITPTDLFKTPNLNNDWLDVEHFAKVLTP